MTLGIQQMVCKNNNAKKKKRKKEKELYSLGLPGNIGQEKLVTGKQDLKKKLKEMTDLEQDRRELT